MHLDVPVGRLPAAVEAAVYFVCSEGLTNAAKYAGASGLTVPVSPSARAVIAEISVDGAGGADLDRGSGLRGLADGVETLGGTLQIDSPLGSGTRLRAILPLGEDPTLMRLSRSPTMPNSPFSRLPSVAAGGRGWRNAWLPATLQIGTCSIGGRHALAVVPRTTATEQARPPADTNINTPRLGSGNPPDRDPTGPGAPFRRLRRSRAIRTFRGGSLNPASARASLSGPIG